MTTIQIAGSMLLGMTLCSIPILAQQPVTVELLKTAEAIVLPPATADAAYQAVYRNGKADPSILFGLMEHRFTQIFSGLAQQTDAQRNKLERQKQHPAAPEHTGVDASTIELAAKMQDPAFVKKLEAMTDIERAQYLSEYASKSANAVAKKVPPANASTTIELNRMLHEFNESYRPKNLEAVEIALQQIEIQTNSRLEQELNSLQKEKEALPAIGKGTSSAVLEQHKTIDNKIITNKLNAMNRQLKGYREAIEASITLYKMAAAPFDKWIAESGYGDRYKKTAQADLLAQVAGHQDSYFRILYRLQELSRDITLQAAALYAELKMNH